MQAAQEVLEKIDKISKKLTSQEYKEICDCLTKLSTEEYVPGNYEITIIYNVVEVKLKNTKEEEPTNDDEMEPYINIRTEDETFLTKLRKCSSCYNCEKGEPVEKCVFKSLYDGGVHRIMGNEAALQFFHSVPHFDQNMRGLQRFVDFEGDYHEFPLLVNTEKLRIVDLLVKTTDIIVFTRKL
jgi:hypothetical protein